MQVSLQTAYENLRLLEQVDIVTSASYRKLAQEILADPSVSLSWRQAISDRLNHANHLLALVTVGSDDSY
jgi:Fe2+ or Zn2+ uptake regulation protein